MNVKVGDVVIGIRGWEGYGEGRVVRIDKDYYYVCFFSKKDRVYGVVDAGIEFVRESTPLEKALL